MKKAGVLLVFMGFLGAGLLGSTAQKWLVRTSDDVLKGKCQGVSVSSEGELFLAPKEETLEAPAEEFLLCLAAGPDGSFFLGTGHAGKIYKVSREGKPELYYQAGEMDVSCLVVGQDGVLYAGTSPNGKIYKITEKGKADVFFNPGEKYIWALLPGEGGKLLAAVGESGGIYEISAQGEGHLLLKVQENHVLCLKRDKNGDLFAGSGGNGLVYRLTKTGRTSVLFESPYEEVKSLDFDGEGNVIVAASGTPTKAKKEEVTLAAAPTPEVEVTVSTARPAAEPAAAAAITAASLAAALTAGKEPSAVYVVSPEGAFTKIWSSAEEMIYAVLWRESEKKALIGTGGRGRIYAVDKNQTSSLLLQKSSEQVFAFLPVDSRVYVMSNNPPRLDVILPEQRFDGEYLSAVQDARLVSTWGQIRWQSDLPAGTSLQLQTRSGNSSEPSSTWSEWSPPYRQKEGEQVLSPKARFLQFRALLKTDSGRVSPRLQSIVLNYLQTNVAPVVKRVDALPPNVVFLKPPETEDVILGAAKNLGTETAKTDELTKLAGLAKKTERKGLQTILWDADDENGDNLRYNLFLRKETETAWRVLEEDWTDSLYAFDTAALPDGIYRLRVMASDAPSNPAGLALTSDKTSDPLTVDNTPPVFKNVVATRDGNSLKLSFQAEDNLSPITEARCLIRPGEWQTILPVDGICDSRQETFNLTLRLPANPDNLLVLQVKDDHGNVGVYRQTF